MLNSLPKQTAKYKAFCLAKRLPLCFLAVILIFLASCRLIFLVARLLIFQPGISLKKKLARGQSIFEAAEAAAELRSLAPAGWVRSSGYNEIGRPIFAETLLIVLMELEFLALHFF